MNSADLSRRGRAVARVADRDAVRAGPLYWLDNGAVRRRGPGRQKRLDALDAVDLHLEGRLQPGSPHRLRLREEEEGR